MAPAGLRRANAGNCLRHRHQEARYKQDKPAHGIENRRTGGDQQRRDNSDDGSRHPAREIAFHGFHAFHDQRAFLPDRALIRGALRQKAREDAGAEARFGFFPGGGLGAFLGDTKPRHDQRQRPRADEIRPGSRGSTQKRGQQAGDQQRLRHGGKRQGKAKQDRPVKPTPQCLCFPR